MYCTNGAIMTQEIFSLLYFTDQVIFYQKKRQGPKDELDYLPTRSNTIPRGACLNN